MLGLSWLHPEHLKVCRADGLADHVPVVTAARDGQLVLHHDVEELLADLEIQGGQCALRMNLR